MQLKYSCLQLIVQTCFQQTDKQNWLCTSRGSETTRTILYPFAPLIISISYYTGIELQFHGIDLSSFLDINIFQNATSCESSIAATCAKMFMSTICSCAISIRLICFTKKSFENQVSPVDGESRLQDTTSDRSSSKPASGRIRSISQHYNVGARRSSTAAGTIFCYHICTTVGKWLSFWCSIGHFFEKVAQPKRN